MRVCIYGFGFLGQAMHRLLKDSPHPIYVVDPAMGYNAIPQIVDMAIICVPTPMSADGSCDTSIVDQVVRDTPAPLVLIKSTVKPGTTDRLRAETGKDIVFSPEFMGESKYYVPPQYLDPRDAASHGFMILGGESHACSRVIDFFLPVLGPTCRFRMMETVEAELVKYFENSFFALKVTYANEIRRICDAFGANYHRVREGWLDDPRVGPMHTAAFADSPGFGGKCLPKDIAALAAACREAGVPSDLLEAIITANNKATQ